jgi:hypothetical protein
MNKAELNQILQTYGLPSPIGPAVKKGAMRQGANYVPSTKLLLPAAAFHQLVRRSPLPFPFSPM